MTKIILAPMEGVVDFRMRQLLSRQGGIDRCVTEFIRITDHLLPRKVFLRYCPELHNQSKTESGTPVYIQLLGGKAWPMAGNAAKAARLGAAGIDINFGCPAKTVNKNDGGAKLLTTPQRLYDIILACRNNIHDDVPLTAKMRLGYDDKSLALENAQAIAEAGVNELVVHGRTKVQGYQPPADWQTIREIRQSVNIPVIANGEIWNPDDYRKCREVSQCEHIMLGRGLLSQPNLARQIKYRDKKLDWQEVILLMEQFFAATARTCPNKFRANLLKQWLVYLQLSYPQAHAFFQGIKRIKDCRVIEDALLAEKQNKPLAAEI